MTKDRTLAFLTGLFTIVMFVETFKIAEKSNWQAYGSAFYPRVLLLVIGVLAIFLFINSFRDKRTTAEQRKVKD
ncbi:hypothetical protein PY093_02455 [Cytobacillus sp. S13-E01]|uniref:hypothetical protein n=1 Tax=Cytobacillus sp. S13-E01 TaxID=3031326 RepID=UPI0023D83558|nr:hypothetical protein [Cytobacillus sp. S13-E01]MDF0725574.1 hypothetical protein [Cytobacillus sp. S13-E01]